MSRPISPQRFLPLKLRFRSLTQACLLILTYTALLPFASAKFKWSPVDAADLAATSSTSAPGADTEILFSRHRMDTTASSTFTEHHIQAKIYTRKGVESTALFGIEHEKKQKIWESMARVVKPDGKSVELTAADFHDSTIVKMDGYEVIRTSFAFPGVEPGDVLEYHWSETIEDRYGYYKQYIQAEDVPTREFVFEIARAQRDFSVAWYNCDHVENNAKSHKIVVRNLPPFIAEPLMPPDTEFRAWIKVQFTSQFERFYKADDAWKSIGDYLAEQFRLDVAPNAAVKSKAQALTAGLVTPEEKLARLYQFAQTEIQNLTFFESAALAEAKRKREEQDEYQSSAQTLSRGTGNSRDIDRLFAGLAVAAGFEVRHAISSNKNRILSMNRPQGWVFADREAVAVKLGDKWRYFTPGQRLVPFALLDARDEGAVAWVCDEKKSWWALTQVAGAELTEAKRNGRFTLDEEGTLDGEVEIHTTGQLAIRSRDSWWEKSAEELSQIVRESVAARIPTAEVSEIQVENLHTIESPVVTKYHVHVPGYADVIGSRLGVSLNFFEAGTHALFTNDTRRYPIFFDFAERTDDDIQIVIPKNFTLDGASAPPPAGNEADPITARYDVRYLPKSHTIGYGRHHIVGKAGNVHYVKESYAPLKSLYDRIHRSDGHQIVLKPKVAATPAAANPPPAVTPAATPAQPAS